MADEKKVLIHVEDVKMHFPIKKKSIINKTEVSVKAVDGRWRAHQMGIGQLPHSTVGLDSRG